VENGLGVPSIALRSQETEARTQASQHCLCRLPPEDAPSPVLGG
jgi:hypothetical protein